MAGAIDEVTAAAGPAPHGYFCRALWLLPLRLCLAASVGGGRCGRGDVDGSWHGLLNNELPLREPTIARLVNEAVGEFGVPVEQFHRHRPVKGHHHDVNVRVHIVVDDRRHRRGVRPRSGRHKLTVRPDGLILEPVVADDHSLPDIRPGSGLGGQESTRNKKTDHSEDRFPHSKLLVKNALPSTTYPFDHVLPTVISGEYRRGSSGEKT